jgi:hypothetical protein
MNLDLSSDGQAQIMYNFRRLTETEQKEISEELQKIYDHRGEGIKAYEDLFLYLVSHWCEA